MIELRLDRFGGSENHLSRVNYHVIFSDELPADVIEQQFLNSLVSKYTLSPEYDFLRTTRKWQALPTKNSLADLGKLIIESVPSDKRGQFGVPLSEGFNNLCTPLDAIHNALDSHYFKNKYVTAVGKTEWADIKWNDHSIADKKTIINGAHLVFTASESVPHWDKSRRSLQQAEVNCRLLDCSDAHVFRTAAHKDRIGQCLTWVKADPTFEGLRQLLVEFDERHFVGEVPIQEERVRTNPTKYLHSIAIRRTPGSPITEAWFDNEIHFNPGLVAIIGNKGKGKSCADGYHRAFV